MTSFSIIVAVDSKFGIGKNGLLPWHLPSDLKYFKKITTQENAAGKINAVIMGRKTWESIPAQFRPLPQRLNIVISRQTNLSLPLDVVHATSLEDALDSLGKKKDTVGEIFVIGGAQIFKEAVLHPSCRKIFLTRVQGDFFCDTFFPDVLQQYPHHHCQSSVMDQGRCLSFLVYSKNVS